MDDNEALNPPIDASRVAAAPAQSYLAFLLPLRPDRPPTRGGMWVVGSQMTRLRWMRFMQVFALERMPETLQFKNQRGALRSHTLAT